MIGYVPNILLALSGFFLIYLVITTFFFHLFAKEDKEITKKGEVGDISFHLFVHAALWPFALLYLIAEKFRGEDASEP